MLRFYDCSQGLTLLHLILSGVRHISEMLESIVFNQLNAEEDQHLRRRSDFQALEWKSIDDHPLLSERIYDDQTDKSCN